MSYGARIMKRNLLPDGRLYLKVAIWDDPARKNEKPDVIQDFVLKRKVPASDVFLTERRGHGADSEIRRGDTGEWVNVRVWKEQLLGEDGRPTVPIAKRRLTPEQYVRERIDRPIRRYVARWRAMGKPKGDFTDPRYDNKPDASERLPLAFKAIPEDVDE